MVSYLISFFVQKLLMRKIQLLVEKQFPTFAEYPIYSKIQGEAAVDAAAEVCVENKILVDFLIKHRADVKEMILSEYDEELHLMDTYNCGYADGVDALSRLVTVLIKEKRMDDLEKAMADASFRHNLLRKYGLENE